MVCYIPIHKNQKIKKNKKNSPGARDFSLLIYISAIAGVSSPNCGDKVEVQLLFMAFFYLAYKDFLLQPYMDFPDYMVLNPMHIEFNKIPKIAKVLGPPPYIPSEYKVGWIPCPKCMEVGIEYCKRIGHIPYSFKAVHPHMGLQN